MIEFVVLGNPVTQGSMKAFAHGGRAFVTHNTGGKLQAWRHAVSDEARKARESAQTEMLDGPVVVEVEFRMAKPKSAPKRRETWPIGARSGDLDKLARAVLDALTGVIFLDDSQVIALRVTKEWGPPGATVRISALALDCVLVG